MQAFIGTCSLTLLLPKRIAEELGLQNGDYLKCYVEGNRLIVERSYRSALSGRTNGLEADH
jgi:antitoxin component of MazEF toxin-antitoxin module